MLKFLMPVVLYLQHLFRPLAGCCSWSSPRMTATHLIGAVSNKDTSAGSLLSLSFNNTSEESAYSLIVCSNWCLLLPALDSIRL